MSSVRLLFVALPVVLFAAWTQFLASRAERDHPPAGRFVVVEGLRIHYVEQGAGSAVVLLHGAFGGCEDWSATILDRLAAHHRVIAFDRPGYGFSDRPASGVCGPAEQARILRAALVELHVERPVLVGFSWSGALVTAWALAHQDELAGLVTINGVLYPWPGPTDLTYTLCGVPLVGDLIAGTIAAPIGMLTARGAVENSFAPAAVTSNFVRGPIELSLRPRSLLAVAQDMRLLKPAVAIQCTRYGELHLPLMLVAGRGDRIAHWDFHSLRLHEVLPDSELVVVEGAGHQILYSHPDDVFDAIERLCARAAVRENTAKK